MLARDPNNPVSRLQRRQKRVHGDQWQFDIGTYRILRDSVCSKSHSFRGTVSKNYHPGPLQESITDRAEILGDHVSQGNIFLVTSFCLFLSAFLQRRGFPVWHVG